MAVSTVLSVLVAGLSLGYSRYREKQFKEALLKPLQWDLWALCESTSHAGDRLVQLEQQLRELLERQQQVEMRAPANHHFQHAIALVQRGASTDELVMSCGLARGEAELLHLLHRANGEQEPRIN
jgi:bifunctional pyridoxal-dependent enzyme with beta-cystathionase and maltose regulon repressor activities